MAKATPLTAILYRKIFGGGGSVTPDSIVTATGQMTPQQAADTLENIGGIGDVLVEITYSALKTLRDGGNLVPGMQYRITDYVCTVANDSEARAISHPYDIIVTADTENSLNENARACLHEGDAYYSAQGAQADLSAWELKYCLDNDTNRFAWADATNGKGVVFWLKDDWNNECPYDFKQIQFKRYKVTAYPMSNQLVGKYIQKQHNTNLTNSTSDTVFVYTFSTVINSQYEDASVYNYAYVGYGKMHCCNNKISSCYITDSAAQKLNNITLATDNGTYQYANTFDFGCESISLLGSTIYANTFGPQSTRNVLYNGINNAYLGKNVNNVGVSFSKNVLGHEASNICMGGERNVFGAGCSVFRFGIGCNNNVFGAYCQAIDFCTTSSGGTYQNYLSNIEIAPECSFLILYATTSLTNAARNCKILQGVKGTSQSNKLSIELPVGATYCTFIGNNTNGVVKTYNVMDSAL